MQTKLLGRVSCVNIYYYVFTRIPTINLCYLRLLITSCEP